MRVIVCGGRHYRNSRLVQETLCLVECEGDIAEQSDKLVCRRRRIVARFDATDLLRTHARKSALSVIHLWDAPAVVREYSAPHTETNQ